MIHAHNIPVVECFDVSVSSYLFNGRLFKTETAGLLPVLVRTLLQKSFTSG